MAATYCGQRAPARAGRRAETRELQKLVAALEVLVDAFLQHAAEGFPDLFELGGILLGELFPARTRARPVTALADLRHLRVVLQDLAAKC